MEGIPAGHVTLAQLVHWFPAVPAPLLVTLAIMAMCDDRVTPFRLCACGCGAPVHGKAVLAFVACRKRIQRERDAQRRGAPKQFNLV